MNSDRTVTPHFGGNSSATHSEGGGVVVGWEGVKLQQIKLTTQVPRRAFSKRLFSACNLQFAASMLDLATL